LGDYGSLAPARVRLEWTETGSQKYQSTNLARNSASDQRKLGQVVFEKWFRYLIDNAGTLPAGALYSLELAYTERGDRFFALSNCKWLEEY
ncbi:hypothetical protein ACQ7B2_12715, partial [Escherichia coli]